MENLDSKTLVHIGTELLLIGGLGFWMKKRIDTADAKIEELEKRLTAYEEMFRSQQNMLAKHEAVLRQVLGMPPANPPANTGTGSGGGPTNQPRSSVPSSQNNQQLSPSPPLSMAGDNHKKFEESVERQERTHDRKDHEEEISPEDLDNILKAELSSAKNNSANTASEDVSIEIETSTKKRKPKRKTVTKKKTA